MMTGDRLDLGHDPARSASYVGHWVKALREDSREIYRAARDAQDISDFLIQPERDRVAEREAARAGGRPGEGARACRTAVASGSGDSPRARSSGRPRDRAGGPVPAVPAHARGRPFRAGDDSGRMIRTLKGILLLVLAAAIVVAEWIALTASSGPAARAAGPAEVRTQALGGGSCRWEVVPAEPWSGGPLDGPVPRGPHMITLLLDQCSDRTWTLVFGRGGLEWRAIGREWPGP